MEFGNELSWYSMLSTLIREILLALKACAPVLPCTESFPRFLFRPTLGPNGEQTLSVIVTIIPRRVSNLRRTSLVCEPAMAVNKLFSFRGFNLLFMIYSEEGLFYFGGWRLKPMLSAGRGYIIWLFMVEKFSCVYEQHIRGH